MTNCMNMSCNNRVNTGLGTYYCRFSSVCSFPYAEKKMSELLQISSRYMDLIAEQSLKIQQLTEANEGLALKLKETERAYNSRLTEALLLQDALDKANAIICQQCGCIDPGYCENSQCEWYRKPGNKEG